MDGVKRRRRVSERELFLEVAAYAEHGACVIWPFAVRKSSGYGAHSSFEFGAKKNKDAHRAACELRHGPSPEEKPLATHTCGHELCCNGAHLKWGSVASNTEDLKAHGKLSLPRGLRTRLTDAQVDEIRSSDLSHVAMAEKFGVRPDYVGVLRRFEARTA